MRHVHLVVSLVTVITASTLLFYNRKIEARPSNRRQARQDYQLPSGFKPFGPSHLHVYPDLIQLQGGAIPDVVTEIGNAAGGIPPTYFNLQSGRLIGAAAVDGEVLTTDPLNLYRRKTRTLFLIRREPGKGIVNAAYIEPKTLRQKLGRWLYSTSIRRLGINIGIFDVVTMDLNNAVYRNRAYHRSAWAATSRGMRIHSGESPQTYPQIENFMKRKLGPKVIVASGDGGRTLRYPAERNPVICLTLRYWPVSTASR